MNSSTKYSLYLVLLLFVINCALCIESSEKLVIDSDGGADDAAAILLALSAWANHVLKAITIANASDIHVYAGAKKPLVEHTSTDYYYGQDGLGDFRFEEEISGKVDESMYAAVALIHLAKLYPRKLNVLCLRPLTNIAIAAALDPSFMENVKRFYIMGGSVSGIGNRSPGVEFNFAADPKSNFIVLNYTREFKKQEQQEPSILYPWETVLNAKIEKTWRMNKLGSIGSKIVNFLNKGESKSLKDGSRFWNSADVQATAIMLWPHLSCKSLVTNVTPVIDGAARGSVLVDYTGKSGKPKNVELVQAIDSKGLQRKLLFHFS